MTYRTAEEILQHELLKRPEDPDDGRKPDDITEDQFAPPRFMWIECPICGGIYTVFSETTRARIMANLPVPLSFTTFVDRAGEQYIHRGDSIGTVHCLDCEATWKQVQDRFGAFIAVAGPWFRTTDELPDKFA